MSKIDAMRAMREARYAERQGRGTAAPPARRPAAPTPTPSASEGSAPAGAGQPEVATDQDALCGHRSMNGRTCTRERGHAAKSHRYG